MFVSVSAFVCLRERERERLTKVKEETEARLWPVFYDYDSFVLQQIVSL